MKLQLIDAGEIVTTHGVKGEMKVLCWLDSPEDLCGFKRCVIGGREYKISSCRVQKTCNLLKVDTVDTMEVAQSMRGKIVQLHREDISDDVIFAAELIGVEVYSDNRFLGKIEDVLDYPGNQVYVVRGENEYLIPAVKAFVHHTDLDTNRMDVTVIEGMRSNED